MELQPEYIGQTLLKLGFEAFFRYLFRVIEGRPFIMEPIHPDLFNIFEDIYNLKRLRQTVNIFPRSSKTTLCKYFIVYSWCKNPKCNFIYTSYSQSLLNDIARDIQNIMEHPAFKAMFPVKSSIESESLDPIDEFWRQYWNKSEDNKNIYSSKKIVTYAGGICIFVSAGGQILGFGAGIRGADDFSGCLILDDFDKPADIASEVLRAKTKRYYSETLLSRLNDYNVPILNVQQRLHVDDISGFLKDKYGFDVLKKPLLNIRGECQAPSQYDEKRLKELQFDKSAFSAQYQQEPTLEEGNLIKRDWWQYYKPEETPVEGVLIITADTAYKKSKTADFSCLQCWELKTGKLLMRDMIVDKWEFPELLENAKMFWDKWTRPEMIVRAKYFFIEDKASGISLVQTLEDLGINTVAWKPKDFDFPDDKVGRTKEFSWAVFSGLVFLPENNKMSEYLVDEAAAFKEDMSHYHDDACFVAGTKIATLWGYKNIEDLKAGDLVITPWGLSPVIRTTNRIKPVINNIGLTGTKDHKIYTTQDYSFDSLENVNYSMISKLTLRDLILWQVKFLFCSMVKNTTVTRRQDITKIKNLLTEKEKQLGFTGVFMSFIQERKFLKAFIFIIKMKIKIITILAIWFLFHTANTLKYIAKGVPNFGKDRKCKRQAEEEEKKQKFGTLPKREKSGTLNIKKNILQKDIYQKYVLTADENLIPPMIKENKHFVAGVEINILKENCEREKKKKVYNLTVESGCYYANNVLVSNCDAANMSFSIWRYYGGMRDTEQQ